MGRLEKCANSPVNAVGAERLTAQLQKLPIAANAGTCHKRFAHDFVTFTEHADKDLVEHRLQGPLRQQHRLRQTRDIGLVAFELRPRRHV